MGCNPTSYAYAWYRNGTLLAGFAGSTYTLGTLDEGTTFTCVVTATDAAGSASAGSNAVKVPVPKVPHCPAATGSMTVTTIGQITLGMTQSRARYLYRQHSNHGKQYEDFFCLTPIGVRVGYASPILLNNLPKQTQLRLRGRVVWASTSNQYYSLDGVRAGESIATAARAVDTEAPFHIGLNYWYLARKATYTAVLKVRGVVVEELGIADNRLTKTRNGAERAHALVLLTGSGLSIAGEAALAGNRAQFSRRPIPGRGTAIRAPARFRPPVGGRAPPKRTFLFDYYRKAQ